VKCITRTQDWTKEENTKDLDERCKRNKHTRQLNLTRQIQRTTIQYDTLQVNNK